MGLRRNPLTWRKAGVASTSLVMLFSAAAVGIAPVAALAAGHSETVCAEQADGHGHDSLARARPGASGAYDPNHLTAAQLTEREADLRTALLNRASKTLAGPVIQATVTIPVVVHVIQKNTTRAGGNIPDSMVNSQITVLNKAYAGSTGGAADRVRFPVQKINRVTNPRGTRS